ncbi:PAS domain-containing protein [Porifericola rhodea]|uniref:GAF domain-containing protein n=1 Tax=Porifericola rhodea TaxID=930972 RepID=UPI0026666A15|nr:GAF domain-containing protein [Porifericola rhodea]WKN30549.1 PAS domain-containing protein [Porifericola rhodea]
MNEQERLKELQAYKILDTPPEKELDELAEIASVICDTPISLLSFVDEDRQWFKSIRGLSVDQTPRDQAFCQHALHLPEEVLVVDDPLNDERFKDNPHVNGDPYIRFYAGAPLQTPKGNVLGTLCVIDNKPRQINEKQKKALQILAKKAMNYLETRKILLEQDTKIERSAHRLKKLTDQTPGVVFQLEMDKQGKLSFPFLSKGIEKVFPKLPLAILKEQPELGLKMIYPDDTPHVNQTLNQSYKSLQNWSAEFRMLSNDNTLRWFWANAKPELQENGSVMWYGYFRDITSKKEYVKALEQILFDISHVLRSPVATLLGISNVLEDNELDTPTLNRFLKHIRDVSEEMDHCLTTLDHAYNDLKYKATNKETVPVKQNR